ncbi:hypothetical protein IQ238_00185 [Pleurocapsales cyanobacterium LEGE 06147]|nr:hypothetical protein [Pleurocapsales cyanobacterium LEGE 06147]
MTILDTNLSNFVGYFEFITDDCGFLLPSSQKERLETLCRDLKNAIANHRKGEMQKLSEDAKREIENLPDKIKIILACRDGIARAYQIEPNQARAMEAKLWQMIDAMRRDNEYEAERLFRELAQDIRPYLEREIPTVSIATGLTR